jgi:hypothetical protein
LRLDVLQIAAKCLSAVDSIRGADFQSRGLLLALRSGSRSHIAQAMTLEGAYQATQSSFKRAQLMVDRALEISEDPNDPFIVGLVTGTRGITEYFRGDAPRAAQLLAEAEHVVRRIPGANWELASSKLFYLFAARVIGDYVIMRERYRQYLAEARQRGDQYVESSMRRMCVPMWLADDAAAEAARELERASWVPESTGFHVQHFHELIARGEIALYTGEPADEAMLSDSLERLSRSLLLRITSIRIQHEYLLGRLAIARKDAARTVERHARALTGVGNPVAHVWARALRAGAAIAARDRARAESLVVACEEAAIAAGMKATAAAARYRLAELRGDHGLLASASQELTLLGVRVPRNMTALLIPTGQR